MQLVNKSRYALNLNAVDRSGEQPRTVSAFLGTTPEDSRIEIDDADWSVLEQHAGVRQWLKMGWLTPVRERGQQTSAASDPKQAELDELSAREAIELVSLTDDPVELHGMLDEEKRSTVRKAIERRIEGLRDES